MRHLGMGIGSADDQSRCPALELQAARAEVKRLGAAVSRLEAVEAEARELKGQRDTLARRRLGPP